MSCPKWISYGIKHTVGIILNTTQQNIVLCTSTAWCGTKPSRNNPRVCVYDAHAGGGNCHCMKSTWLVIDWPGCSGTLFTKEGILYTNKHLSSASYHVPKANKCEFQRGQYFPSSTTFYLIAKLFLSSPYTIRLPHWMILNQAYDLQECVESSPY